NHPIQTYVVGTISHDPGSPVIAPETLFQIGSITKSFTAALLLLAEGEGRIKLQDSFSQYLPEYPRWSGLTITQLLNMTSGLPNYTDSATVNLAFAQTPDRRWSDRELIAVVYPQPSQPAPPLRTGYDYTNTAYLLGGLVLETVFKDSFANLIGDRLIKPLELENTVYPVPTVPPAVRARMAQGYNFNPYTNPEITGSNVTAVNLSWASSAGGLVANSEDIIRWVKALFIEDDLLTPAQKQQLQQLVSTRTGQAIAGTDADHPQGFGLGVIQGYDENWGKYWFYQGETIGYRSFYVYFPCNQVIISALFNSSVDAQNNHARPLIEGVYNAILADNPQLGCKSE
ncbi:MAG: serine hydrolase domain-containing protein, partial [Synechocystis sp.]